MQQRKTSDDNYEYSSWFGIYCELMSSSSSLDAAAAAAVVVDSTASVDECDATRVRPIPISK